MDDSQLCRGSSNFAWQRGPLWYGLGMWRMNYRNREAGMVQLLSLGQPEHWRSGGRGQVSWKQRA